MAMSGTQENKYIHSVGRRNPVRPFGPQSTPNCSKTTAKTVLSRLMEWRAQETLSQVGLCFRMYNILISTWMAKYNDGHNFIRGRMQHPFTRLYSWGVCREVFRKCGLALDNPIQRLHMMVHVVVHIQQFLNQRNLHYQPFGPWKHFPKAMFDKPAVARETDSSDTVATSSDESGSDDETCCCDDPIGSDVE